MRGKVAFHIKMIGREISIDDLTKPANGIARAGHGFPRQH